MEAKTCLLSLLRGDTRAQYDKHDKTLLVIILFPIYMCACVYDIQKQTTQMKQENAVQTENSSNTEEISESINQL